MVSRKDFEAIAKAIKQGKSKWEIATLLCEYFEEQNCQFCNGTGEVSKSNLFDRQRFLNACQKESILGGIQ